MFKKRTLQTSVQVGRDYEEEVVGGRKVQGSRARGSTASQSAKHRNVDCPSICFMWYPTSHESDWRIGQKLQVVARRVRERDGLEANMIC
jgi:hypothetical protein